MKKFTILSITIATAMSLLLACNSTQTADQFLKNDNQRKDIVVAIAHHQPYMIEMMHEMMNNDSSKQMMGHSMMSDPGMMKMMMNGDKSMHNKMMGHMMDMAEKDSAMCSNMLQMMKEKPQIMNRMREMDMSSGSMKH